MQRAWLRPGPGDPQAEDEAMLRLLWLCGSVAEDSLIRQLADLMLGDLPVSAWASADGSGWSPLLIGNLSAAKAVQSAVDRAVVTREWIAAPAAARTRAFVRIWTRLKRRIDLGRRAVEVDGRRLSRPEREAAAIVDARRF